MYEIRLLDEAVEELRSIDRSVAKRIMQRVEWLAENFDVVSREALTGRFADLLKLRVGDYRVLYEVLEAEQLIVIHVIGHRRDIYRRH